MPTRLLELVRNYLCTQGLSPPTTDLQLLPYPRFTTPLHSALFVRVQYEVASEGHIPKTKVTPFNLLADVFSTKVEEGEFVELWANELWAKITSAASKTGSEPLSHVLANESLRLLSLVIDKSKEEVKLPTFNPVPLFEPRQQHSSSTGAVSTSPITPSTVWTESTPFTAIAHLSPISIGSDWEQSCASTLLDEDHTFLSSDSESTLFDTDVENAGHDIPVPISRMSSPCSDIITECTRGSSLDNLKPSSKPRQEGITASQLEVIELDEAFVDFCSDALLDPITSDWPTFVVCKFEPSLVPDLTFGSSDEPTRKTMTWLVVEQVYSIKPCIIPSSTLPISGDICTTCFARYTDTVRQTSFQLLEHVADSNYIVDWLAEGKEDIQDT